MLTQEVTRVHRSRIIELSFRQDDVLSNEAAKSNRKEALLRAMNLGNNFKQAVTLQFRTFDGSLRETEATVWAVTDKNVELKGGKIIPMAAIFHVEL
ncbi:MAG: hypothetical protein R8G66_13870 [Cytophagales bacterium]|nr:hypothetical protein [Cytophagales bacterium]